jgi:hypothetical protein
MWVSWDECILLGTYKIMIMILLSHICQFSNRIAYQFLNKLICAILMKLQIYIFLLVSLFVILVAFLKAYQLSTFPYWYLWCLWHVCWRGVNSTNVLDEGLRIGETRRRINSKVNSVKQGGSESKHGCKTWLAFNLSHTVPSWPLYIGGQVSRIG